MSHFFHLRERMTTRGGDEKCSRSKIDEERDQSVALRVFDSCLHKQWLDEQSFSSFFSFTYALSLFLSSHLMSEGANFEYSTRRRQVCERRKKGTNEQASERTNEPASFCLYSSYSRRTIVYIYIFLSPTIKSAVSERSTLCLCLFIRPVRFSSHHS